jgi:hypothetical protein
MLIAVIVLSRLGAGNYLFLIANQITTSEVTEDWRASREKCVPQKLLDTSQVFPVTEHAS